MMIPHRFTAAIAALLLPAQAASAAGPTCFTPAEAQALITSFLPDIVRTMADTCRPSLPGDVFLVRSSETLAQRYTPAADAAWKSARPAMVKLVGKADFMSRLDDATARKLFAAGVASEIGKDVKPQDCVAVDRIFFALEPLPPANLSMLIGTIMELGGRGKKQVQTGFQICPLSATQGK